MLNKKIYFYQIVILFFTVFLLLSKQLDAQSENFKRIEPSKNIDANESVSNGRSTIITKTVALVSSAVVGISVTEIKQYADPFSPFMNDPFFRQFFGDQNRTQEVKGLGSGFLVSADGYIITNDHVAGNAKKIVVTLTNGKHYDAELVGTDKVSDVCLIKIKGDNFPFLKFGNSDNIMIGEWSIALGNPFGLFDVNDKPTVTVGVISASGMNLDPVQDRYYLNMLQTDAAINGGNSGGPLVNALGEVIGMNTIIFTSGGSQGNIGLGFAIPINKIRNTMIELKSSGSIDRNFVTGLGVQDINEGIAKYFNLETSKGVIITEVSKNSPASIAGLEKGDVITEIEGTKINNRNTLLGVLQEYRTGQTIEISILRDNSIITKKMTLKKR